MATPLVLLVIGEADQYDDAERVRDVLERKLTVKFRVEELEDLGNNIKSDEFMTYASKAKAVLLICSETFTSRINTRQQISFDAGGTLVTLDGSAIPNCLHDQRIKEKFIILSFDTPASIPEALIHISRDDIFTFTKNITRRELEMAMKNVAVRIVSK